MLFVLFNDDRFAQIHREYLERFLKLDMVNMRRHGKNQFSSRNLNGFENKRKNEYEIRKPNVFFSDLRQWTNLF